MVEEEKVAGVEGNLWVKKEGEEVPETHGRGVVQDGGRVQEGSSSVGAE